MIIDQKSSCSGCETFGAAAAATRVFSEGTYKRGEPLPRPFALCVGRRWVVLALVHARGGPAPTTAAAAAAVLGLDSSSLPPRIGCLAGPIGPRQLTVALLEIDQLLPEGQLVGHELRLLLLGQLLELLVLLLDRTKLLLEEANLCSQRIGLCA